MLGGPVGTESPAPVPGSHRYSHLPPQSRLYVLPITVVRALRFLRHSLIARAHDQQPRTGHGAAPGLGQAGCTCRDWDLPLWSYRSLDRGKPTPRAKTWQLTLESLVGCCCDVPRAGGVDDGTDGASCSGPGAAERTPVRDRVCLSWLPTLLLPPHPRGYCASPGEPLVP